MEAPIVSVPKVKNLDYALIVAVEKQHGTLSSGVPRMIARTRSRYRSCLSGRLLCSLCGSLCKCDKFGLDLAAETDHRIYSPPLALFTQFMDRTNLLSFSVAAVFLLVQVRRPPDHRFILV